MVRRFILGRGTVAALLCLMLTLVLTGCSEERKRDAVRLAAELEAKERGETLPPETTAVTPVDVPESTQVAQDQVAARPAGDTGLATADTTSDSTRAVVQDTVVPTPQIQPQGMPPILKEGYAVQVESSPSQKYIMQQIDLFTSRGYEAYLGTITVEDKTYYRLRVGRFTSREEAAKVSAELNTTYGLQSWVDRASW